MIEIVQTSPLFNEWMRQIESEIAKTQERQLELTELFVRHSQAVLDNVDSINKRIDAHDTITLTLDKELTELYQMTSEGAQAHTKYFESTLQNLEILASRVEQLENAKIL